MNNSGDANKMVGEDHFPDAGKMVSDTPRTDAEYERLFEIYQNAERINGPLCCAFENDMRLCRQLERELNAANDRIKRLEKAVDAYRKAYTPDGHVAPHDCFATGPKTGNLWQDHLTCPGCWAELKAKEAKP